MSQATDERPPRFWRWALGLAASVGLTGMLCCVAPMVLFMGGLMGGVYAISFADFFYQADGSAGLGAWVLRVVAIMMGGAGVWRFRSEQNQCSIDPQRKQKNLVLLGTLVSVLGVGFFLTLESLSSWYFDAYIVPAQQAEFEAMELEK